jgi:DNA modification methylase
MRDTKAAPPSRLTDPICVRTGDVWGLGRHRLICGDATKPLTVAKLLRGHVPRLMVTDPPYGVSYEPSWRLKVRPSASVHAQGRVTNDHRADWREAWKLFPGDVAYVWHSACHASTVHASLEAAGFRTRAQIIWDKTRLIISRGHYHWRHEPCWYAVRKGKTANWQGGRKQTTVWPIPHRRSPTGHSAEKPLPCMQRPIENHTLPGEAIYDPFVGSGTSIIAAETVGRACYAVEIDPLYCAGAIDRWQGLTGGRARRISKGIE